MTTPEPRRTALVQRFDKAMGRMQKVGLLDELEQGWCTDKGQFNDRAVSKTYFSEQIACPFLEDESCSIYPVRPSICREYIVYSPPEYCVDPFTNSIERLHLSVCLSQALTDLWAALVKQPPKLVPMTSALQWTRENSSIRTLVVKSEVLVGALQEAIHFIALNFAKQSS
jgi:hypothetical protein